MPINSISELQKRTVPELRVLFHQAQQALAASAPGTAERREARAALDNIERAFRARLDNKGPSGGP